MSILNKGHFKDNVGLGCIAEVEPVDECSLENEDKFFHLSRLKTAIF